MPEDNSPRDASNSSFIDPSGSDDTESAESADDPASDPAEAPDPSVAGNAPSADPDSDSAPDTDSLHFEDEDLGEKLRRASDEEIDGLPFGVIRVDDEGLIEFFNQYESNLSGMEPEEVMGRNFFTEVAPCTNNRLFRGRFKKGVRRGELDETFTYTYTYKMRPTLVDIRLYRDDAGNNWITVQKY